MTKFGEPDTSDIPEADENWFKKAKLLMPVSFKLRWDKPLHSDGKTFVADLHTELGHTFRYVVRRTRPHARDFVARRDGVEFLRKRFDSLETAKVACEVDAVSPKSELSQSKLRSMIDLKKLLHSS